MTGDSSSTWIKRRSTYFSMNPSTTLAEIGTKTVHIRSSTNDTKRATVAVTIAADGTVFREGSRIANSQSNPNLWHIGDQWKGLFKAEYFLMLVYCVFVGFNEISPIGVK